MKNNEPLTMFLVGLLALAILATTGLAFMRVRSVQKLNSLQFRTAVINRNRALVNSLAMEAVEYSKRNPAIEPLLQSVGIRPSTGAPPVRPNPAAKGPGQP